MTIVMNVLEEVKKRLIVLHIGPQDKPKYVEYNCNKITTTQIQISRQNQNDFFPNISHQMII